MAATSLCYPFTAPEAGSFVEVAPGVRWIRLPLAGPLAHINVWAIDDGDGWSLVDTGISSEATVAAWEGLLGGGPLARRLKRVFVTHMHPDHVGMAGWLTRKFGIELWMTRLEYLSCRAAVSDTGRQPPPDALRFFRAAGWNEAAMDGYRARFGSFGRHIYQLPDSYRRLEDGEQVQIGGDRWQVVVGNGHSPEHACLYCPARQLLISGDQVLPRISSNVSVHPMEPDADPMADWYGSIEKLRLRVPDDVLVLPSHNDCFRGLHARLDQLQQGQDEALARLRAGLQQPRRVVDVFGYLFKRPIDPANASLLGMATGESVACLNHLVRRGEVLRSLEDGVAWYQLGSAAPGPAGD